MAFRTIFVWTSVFGPGIKKTMKTKAASPTAPTGRFDSLEQEVFLNLWRTYDRLRALEDELFSRFDLTPQQYNVLRLLRAEHPGTLPTLALANRLVSRAPDITRMLDKLEQRGLIVRDRRRDNRRVVRVGITAAGLALVREIAEPLRACHSRQLGHLAPAALKRLSTLLRAARAPHEDENSSWR
jgi:DNA-binding MarR family transcriptional regulator